MDRSARRCPRSGGFCRHPSVWLRSWSREISSTPSSHQLWQCCENISIVSVKTTLWQTNTKTVQNKTARQRQLSEELVHIGYTQAKSTNAHGEDEDEQQHATSKRSDKAAAFIQFFPPPWSGVLPHQCPAGCCADRNESIQRGADLIMEDACS